MISASHRRLGSTRRIAVAMMRHEAWTRKPADAGCGTNLDSVSDLLKELPEVT
jgi:hypothetical protein